MVVVSLSHSGAGGTPARVPYRFGAVFPSAGTLHEQTSVFTEALAALFVLIPAENRGERPEASSPSRAWAAQVNRRYGRTRYSHSMVLGGFELTS